jgi:hypothetical protein
MHSRLATAALVVMLSVTACATNNQCLDVAIGASYSPFILPIKITVDTQGRISLSLEGTIRTPLGEFSLEGGLASDPRQMRLIVIMNKQQYVYAIGEYISAEKTLVKVTTEGVTTTSVSVKDCRTIVVEIESEGGLVAGAPPTPRSRPPTATPQGYVCANTLPTRLRVGARGYVNSTPVNILCRVPGPCKASDSLNAIGYGARFTVVGGPVCEGGYIWWKVDPDDPRKPTAWTAEGNAYEYYVSPIN